MSTQQTDPDLPPPASSAVGLRAGDVLDGDYEIVRHLASGGMGELYEARHLRLPKRFAVKVIRRVLVSDASILERFRREAEVTSTIGNAHVVDVLDFNVLPDGSPYMVMELLIGEDLSQHLRRLGRCSLQATLTILGQVCDGLIAAHELGILHRDIKPENVFLSRERGRDIVKILDFGLSKLLVGNQLTQSHAVMGTPAYMSPEQIRGEKTVDARSDIYAVGVLTFQLLTGVLPFQGENPFQLFEQVMAELPRSPMELVPELPAEVSAVVLCALSKEPQNRPQSVKAFWDALERAGANRSGAPPQEGVLLPAPPPVQPLGLARTVTPVTPPPRPNRHAAPRAAFAPPRSLQDVLPRSAGPGEAQPGFPEPRSSHYLMPPRKSRRALVVGGLLASLVFTGLAMRAVIMRRDAARAPEPEPNRVAAPLSAPPPAAVPTAIPTPAAVDNLRPPPEPAKRQPTQVKPPAAKKTAVTHPKPRLTRRPPNAPKKPEAPGPQFDEDPTR